LKVWLDGALVEESEARVSAFDHGFQLGDGVFETLRVYGGEPFALGEHLARLHAGIEALRMPAPPADLAAAAREVLRTNDLLDARMRVTVTSGLGPPGLARGGGSPSVLVVAAPLTSWPETGTAILSRFRRDEHSPLAGVKTISLADHVVAYAEARERAADEALLLNTAGELCEATTANVFLVRDGVAATPPLSAGCLAGITRAHVLELGAVERRLELADLDAAEEAFLTSSTREVQPLVAIDGRPLGSGSPGPVTQRLAAAYSELVAARLG
jgi:branched-chain amino acid aminotransferase